MAENADQSAVPGGQALGGAIEQQEDTTLFMKSTQILANQGRAAAWPRKCRGCWRRHQ